MEEVSREKQNHQENEENKNLTSSNRDDCVSCFQDLSFSFSCHYSLLYLGALSLESHKSPVVYL